MCGGTISGTGTMGDRNFRSDNKFVAEIICNLECKNDAENLQHCSIVTRGT